MKDKLTLSIDRALIDEAKAYAKRRGKSVSELVSEYFRALSSRDRPSSGRPGRDRSLPPVVQELIGAGEGREEDYYRYLEEKHQ